MENFYTDGTYLLNNPTWDAEDVEWKIKKIVPLLKEFLSQTKPQRICDIGCGGGKLLSELAKLYPQHTFVGWDLSPDAAKFWNYGEKNISFHAGDIFKTAQEERFDLVLLIDVIEHVENPHQFLANVKSITKNCFFHVPLDLSSLSVLFDYKLIQVRRQVGHIHYFTKGLFLELLREAGLKPLQVSYSDSWRDSPKKTLQTRILNIVRFFINFLSPEVNARLLGANTLFALTQAN